MFNQYALIPAVVIGSIPCTACFVPAMEPCDRAFLEPHGELWRACGPRAELALGDLCDCTRGCTGTAREVEDVFTRWDEIDWDALEDLLRLEISGSI